MSLFWATFLTGVVTALTGGFFLRYGTLFRAQPIAWMRSKPLSWVTFGGASLWFLWHVYHIGQADFGSFRNLLLAVFSATFLGAFFYVRELLAGRGLCCLILLAALPVLNAAYMQYQHPQRLFLVSWVYILIVLAMICGAQPWRLRDALTALARSEKAVLLAGRILAGYGLLLILLSLTCH